MLGVYAVGAPTKVVRHEVCALCRAQTTRVRLFGVPMPALVRGNDFSHYYANAVERAHEHRWRAAATRVFTRQGVEMGCANPGAAPPLMLRPGAEQAVLASLPGPRLRRAFVRSIDVGNPKEGDCSIEEYTIVNHGLRTLNRLYASDPTRKDWPQQLRKLGLYPKTKERS